VLRYWQEPKAAPPTGEVGSVHLGVRVSNAECGLGMRNAGWECGMRAGNAECVLRMGRTGAEIECMGAPIGPRRRPLAQDW